MEKKENIEKTTISSEEKLESNLSQQENQEQEINSEKNDTIPKEIKEEKRKNPFIVIKNITILVASILLSILYNLPKLDSLDAYNSWRIIWGVISVFFLTFWISVVSTLWIKDKFSKKYKVRTITGIVIWLIISLISLINWGRITKNEAIEEDAKNIFSWVSYTEDGISEYASTSEEIKTELWEKLNEFLESVYSKVQESSDIITKYEQEMYADDVFSDEKSMEKSLETHSKVIFYLETEHENYVKYLKEEYNRIFWSPIILTEKQQEMYDKRKKVTDDTIEMYKASKELYTFYSDNIDSIFIENWELKVSGDIYDEYEKLSNDYQTKYDLVQKWRIELSKMSQWSIERYTK